MASLLRGPRLFVGRVGVGLLVVGLCRTCTLPSSEDPDPSLSGGDEVGVGGGEESVAIEVVPAGGGCGLGDREESFEQKTQTSGWNLGLL